MEKKKRIFTPPPITVTFDGARQSHFVRRDRGGQPWSIPRPAHKYPANSVEGIAAAQKAVDALLRGDQTGVLSPQP